MCGIVGIVAKHNGLWAYHRDLFEEMLVADSLRGMDSTGVFDVTYKNQINILKQACEPGLFLRTKSWKDFKENLGGKTAAIVGHNRKATSGDIVSKNAHPFIKGHIVLVHNGYIGNAKSIDSSIEVDSEAIASTLAETEDSVTALEKLWGAWSIVWYNHKTKKLHLARNPDRPMAFCHTTDALIFGSEPGMLEWLLSRRNTKHEPIIETKPYRIYEISLKHFHLTEKDIPSPTRVSTFPTKHIVEGDMDEDIPFQDPRYTSFGEPSDTVVKEMQREYPQNSIVLFEPKGFITAGGHTTVNGLVWVPGKRVFRGVYTPEHGDKEIWLGRGDKEAPLEGVVNFVIRRGDDIKISVSKLVAPATRIKDVEGQAMGQMEWHLICEKHGCSKCAVAPTRNSPEFTKINRVNGSYEIICPTCNFETSSKKSERQTSLPPLDNKQDKPSINENVSDYGG